MKCNKSKKKDFVGKMMDGAMCGFTLMANGGIFYKESPQLKGVKSVPRKKKGKRVIFGRAKGWL
jgi:hypothetical protein